MTTIIRLPSICETTLSPRALMASYRLSTAVRRSPFRVLYLDALDAEVLKYRKSPYRAKGERVAKAIYTLRSMALRLDVLAREHVDERSDVVAKVISLSAHTDENEVLALYNGREFIRSPLNHILGRMVDHAESLDHLDLMLMVIQFSMDNNRAILIGGTVRNLYSLPTGEVFPVADVEEFAQRALGWGGEVPLEWTSKDDFGLLNSP